MQAINVLLCQNGFPQTDWEASWLPESWKERLQLHRQADVPADLEPARHGDGWSIQLALQNLDAILSRHREHYVRGQLSGTAVAMSGRLKISGDIGLAMQLKALFPTLG